MPFRIIRDRTRRKTSAEEPRKRLIEAGLELFGRYSFDGASTRMLAERAGVNLASIKYYFGGKEGLYLAVAEHIVQQVGGLLGPRLAKVRQALRREALSKDQSFHLLCELLEFLITRFLGLPHTDTWLSIILREQQRPTEAFGILFEGFMRPMDEVLFGLTARIMGAGQDDPDVKLRAFAIIGQIMMFHISPTAVRRTLKWENYGPEELEAIRCVIMDDVRAIFAMPRNCS